MNIIPKPYKFEEKPGFFLIIPKTKIQLTPFNPKLQKTAQFLQSAFLNATGQKIPIIPGKAPNPTTITFSICETGLGKEGYKLNINARYIKLEAESETGIFYGIQSLLQLLPNEIHTQTDKDFRWEIPVCKIEDKPRFGWRGLHLDVSRHFFDVNFIKRYIDLMAMHKLNLFHWHLTDDNGWRIEIKKYPKLTEVGAWRAPRVGIDWRDSKPQQSGEKTTYGGYYTQIEIKEIVQYASDRNITILPEIEMPGHTLEVLAAYPELGCTGGPYFVATGNHKPNSNLFCAGKEEVFSFLENVLDEVLELFPSKYIHVGGDEADKGEWKKCPLCQQRIKAEGLADETELQSWFIKRIEKYLITKGRKLIGWDEILEGNLAPETTVMNWRGKDSGVIAAQTGHNVVMSPKTHCYFDHYQANPSTEKAAIGGYTSLKKVYFYEPIPTELSADEAKHVLGAQANVWTEWISTPEHAEYMLLPRLSALAEVLWSPQDSKDWPEFQTRIENFKKRLELLNLNYCPGTYQIEIDTKFDAENNLFSIKMESEIYNAKIHYTLDGNTPTQNSAVYTSPIVIKKTTTINAGIIIDGKLMGNPSRKIVNFHQCNG